jgi:hypothetical protein
MPKGEKFRDQSNEKCIKHNLGTKAMKNVSNTKHHQFKILILQVAFQVVLVIWSKIGNK